MREEGFGTIKSLIILAFILGSAFTVAAMMPPSELRSDGDSPLEVQKVRTSGPAVLIVETPTTWELEIRVFNNLKPATEEEPVERPEVRPSTRGDEEEAVTPRINNEYAIIDVVVKDTFPKEFVVIEYTPSHGRVGREKDERGETILTWNVGTLNPRGRATLEMTVGIADRVFTRPGKYLLNKGASAVGVLQSTREVLKDGPTDPIFVTVTDGTPNEVPVADAGIRQMAFEDGPIYLDGSGSYDPDGYIIKYTWHLGEERLGSSMTTMVYLPVGEHTVTLVVEDNRRARASDEVTVIVYEEGAVMEGSEMTGVVRDATTREGFDPYIVVTNDEFTISTWTDFEGNYRIIGIPEGHYRVTCQQEGYQDFAGTVDIPENTVVQYDIDMFQE